MFDNGEIISFHDAGDSTDLTSTNAVQCANFWNGQLRD